jgi:hypothetical protein
LQVFARDELDHYEHELDLLCTFQECYNDCHQQVVEESCSPTLSSLSIELIGSYIQWHAVDVYNWHMLSENMEKLPDSCIRLTGYKPDKDDPILKIMDNVS